MGLTIGFGEIWGVKGSLDEFLKILGNGISRFFNCVYRESIW